MGKRRRFLTFAVLMLIVIGFITFYQNTILISLGEYLITEYPLEKADAIVVLAGSGPDRILEAVDIYKQGYAPLIILTKVEKQPGYRKLQELGINIPEVHNINQMIAAKLGVPASSLVIIDERVNSTYSEMRALSDFLKERDLESVILVTSKSHTTRATKLFNLVTAGTKLKVITKPSKYDTFDPTKWWKTRRDRKQIVYEYLKLTHYYLRFMLTALSN